MSVLTSFSSWLLWILQSFKCWGQQNSSSQRNTSLWIFLCWGHLNRGCKNALGSGHSLSLTAPWSSVEILWCNCLVDLSRKPFFTYITYRTILVGVLLMYDVYIFLATEKHFCCAYAHIALVLYTSSCGPGYEGNVDPWHFLCFQ